MDNKGPFRDRLEFVGNPERRDGSILIKNLDFSDNGTFTCDAKNPPDIVGRPSSVRLLVFEKGEAGCEAWRGKGGVVGGEQYVMALLRPLSPYGWFWWILIIRDPTVSCCST